MTLKNIIASTVILPLTLLMTVGCGDSLKVTGTVTYPDGTPVEHGCVTFESGDETAFGMLDKKGRYTVGRVKDGDGLLPGNYQVWLTNTNITSTTMEKTGGIQPRTISTTKATVHKKFTSKATSGLKFEAKKGGLKVFDIVVEKPDKVELKVN